MTTPESAKITRVTGRHKRSKSNINVIGFLAGGSKMEVFPKRLLYYFWNLKAITIKSSAIKDIFQSDLKPFSRLVFLHISESDIQVLEEGLFDFNVDLKFLGINSKKIIHIDPNVFDKLTKLRYFKFNSVPCVKKNVDNSESKLKAAIQKVKDQCTSSVFVVLKIEFENLTIEAKKNISAEDLALKFDKFEDNFNNTIFSKYRPLKNEYYSLKNGKELDDEEIIEKPSMLTILVFFVFLVSLAIFVLIKDRINL